MWVEEIKEAAGTGDSGRQLVAGVAVGWREEGGPRSYTTDPYEELHEELMLTPAGRGSGRAGADVVTWFPRCS